MNKLLGFVGGTIGSSVGWWAGAHLGVMSAFMASTVGTGLGIYAAQRFAAVYLD